MSKLWTRETYRNFKNFMEYFSPNEPVFQSLGQKAPIVTHQQIIALRNELKECQQGKKFMLHAGDCAQPFQDAKQSIILEKLNFYRKVRDHLSSRTKKPVTLIGRIAGQYAKPRSQQFMTLNGKQIHNYKGDIVNGMQINEREPETHKLIEGYNKSLMTYKTIQENFPELYTSHQGLILPYEASLTRQVNSKNYCLSAHMIWIGERTRQLDGAHIQFFRGLENPIGIKISSQIDQYLFLDLVRTLNPNNEHGKLLVITRMGKNGILSKLKTLIQVKQKQKLNFLFVCDPMHGNTFTSVKANQLKTRNVEDLLSQINFVKQQMNSNRVPFGLSLEATYDKVTQCFGLAYPFKEQELSKQNFKSKCDPRLNYPQILALFDAIKF